jgi:UDP-glucose 4-epimerase
MRVLVTGAAGFIGSHLCDVLSARGDTVLGVDDLSSGSLENLAGIDVDLTEASILDIDVLTRLSAGVDAVVHLAARASVPRSIENPVASHDANTTGTLRVLEAARAASTGDRPVHVVVASSSSVYGANPTLPKHEGLMTAPLSPYAATKLATEQYTLAWQHSYDMPTLAFRFFNVFGPRQAPGHAYAAVIPAFVHAALRGESLTVHGDGTQSRDFTYVGTVVGVIADALARRVSHPGPVNLAMGSRTTLLELIGELETILGRSVERTHVENRAGDVPHSQSDPALLTSLFPGVQPVALADGLGATVAWMREWLAAR